MSDLLPPNATALERALAGTMERISAVPVLVRQSWDPVNCPAALLPWLAWAFSVDEWDPAWAEADKRAVILAAYDLQRRKGTVGAIKRALAAAGLGVVTIEEGRHRIKYDGVHKYNGWPTYGGGWAWYRVTFLDPLTLAQAATAERLIEANAAFRSELYSIVYTLA